MSVAGAELELQLGGSHTAQSESTVGRLSLDDHLHLNGTLLRTQSDLPIGFFKRQLIIPVSTCIRETDLADETIGVRVLTSIKTTSQILDRYLTNTPQKSDVGLYVSANLTNGKSYDAITHKMDAKNESLEKNFLVLGLRTDSMIGHSSFSDGRVPQGALAADVQGQVNLGHSWLVQAGWVSPLIQKQRDFEWHVSTLSLTRQFESKDLFFTYADVAGDPHFRLGLRLNGLGAQAKKWVQKKARAKP